MILGSGFCNGTSLPTESGLALSKITNLDGSTNNLVFEVHKYLDNGGGFDSTCRTDGISQTFGPLVTWLRQNKRKFFLGEFGGGYEDQSCIKRKQIL